MPDIEYDRPKTVKYLCWTFGLAYLVQTVVWILYANGLPAVGQGVMALMMFIPTLGVLLAGGKLKPLGWKPQIRKNIKCFLIAWLVPAALSAVGAVLYFLIFPNHFDLSGDYVVALAGKDALAQVEAQGLTYSAAILLTLIPALTYAPLINTVTALGEEIGWRGFLYPQLKTRFGRTKGLLLGGVIWGAWHWPLIAMIGYEYGASVANEVGYRGFPVSGMLVFTLFTLVWGVVCDWLYERSGSIWLPSLCHGAVNAALTLPLAVCQINTGTARLLGPGMNGLVSMLPSVVFALVLLFGKRRSR